MKKENRNFIEEEILECEKLWVFIVMIGVGGFLGAYTFNLKGKVFCNAQTANFVMLAVQAGSGNWSKALYYFIPIFAYLSGAMLSEFLPKRINRFGIIRWDTVFVAFEMICLFILGFVPDDAPPQICQVAINFVASMQYNTFRQAKKVSLATTFCTNHLRRIGVDIVKWLTKHSIDAKEELVMHLLMLISFVTCGIISTVLCGIFKGKAVWGAEILLGIVFFALLRADLGAEKDKLDRVPHGH